MSEPRDKSGTATQHGFSGYVEAPRPAELSDGVARSQSTATSEHKPGGGLVKGARNVPSLGGKATKGTTKLSHHIEMSKLEPVYRKRAMVFRRAAAGEIARDVGGGHCGVVASAMVKLAAEAMALAEYALEQGDYEAHRKLGESARMHLVYAREHAAKAAKARKDASNAPGGWEDLNP